MYLKRQSESVPKEAEPTALSAGRHNGRERRVSRHGQRQPISPSSNRNKLVLYDGCVSQANYGDGRRALPGYHGVAPGGFSVKKNKLTVTFRDLEKRKL